MACSLMARTSSFTSLTTPPSEPACMQHARVHSRPHKKNTFLLFSLFITLPQPPPHQTKSSSPQQLSTTCGLESDGDVYPQIAVLRGRGFDEPVDEPASTSHTRGDQLTPPDKEPSNGRGVSKTPNRHLSPPSLPPCGAAFDGALRSAPRGPPPLSPSSPPLPCAPVIRSACAGLPLQPALRLASPCAHPEGRGGLARLPLREKRLELRHAVLRVREEVRLDLGRRSEAGAGRRVAHLVARRERTGRGDARLLPRLDILAHHEELLTARVGATSEGRVLWLGTRGRPPSLPSARSGTRAARPGRFAGG